MGLNDQSSLIMFEQARRQANIIPPAGSNSFYTVGKGEINLLTKRNDPDDYRFELYTNKGIVYTGPANFTIAGDIHDIEKPYENIIVTENTQLSVNNMLTISRGNLDVYGTFQLMQNSQLLVRDIGNVKLYTDSTFIVDDNTRIYIERGSTLTIYGKIIIHLNMVSRLLNTNGITIDSSAVMEVTGLESLGKRVYSLTDFDTELRSKDISMYTQGEKNTPYGRLGYTWVDGSPLLKSQLLDITILNGEAVLGDFKFSVLGTPLSVVNNFQIIRNLKVPKDTTLYISEEYQGCKYVRPSLYLGLIIGNGRTPGNLDISGKVIVDGPNANITMDRGGTIRVNDGAELWLKNNAQIISTHNTIDSLYNTDLDLYAIEQIQKKITLVEDAATAVKKYIDLVKLDGVDTREAEQLLIDVNKVLDRAKALINANDGVERDTGLPVFILYGTLYIEDIKQITYFTYNNIVLGKNAKIIILNPDTGEKRVLFSTPNGILTSDLYRLFRDRIDKVEYHISNNTGIKIDKYYKNFNREFTKWYADRRIEKAIFDKLLIWHDGGYIQLDNTIIPWVTETSNLLDIGQLFKTFGTYDYQRLQECVNLLSYAGAGDILFRFVVNGKIHEVTLCLKKSNVHDAYNHSGSNEYTVHADDDGELFLKNNTSNTSVDNLIHKDSRVVEIRDKMTTFQI